MSSGRITAVGPAGAYDHVDAEVVEADGLVVAPGFIDVHSHADNAPLQAEDDAETTLATFSQRIFPPLHWGWHSFAEFLTAADAGGYVTNYAPLAGHGTLRLAVLGCPTPGHGRACEDGAAARRGGGRGHVRPVNRPDLPAGSVQRH